MCTTVYNLASVFSVGQLSISSLYLSIYMLYGAIMRLAAAVTHTHTHIMHITYGPIVERMHNIYTTYFLYQYNTTIHIMLDDDDATCICLHGAVAPRPSRPRVHARQRQPAGETETESVDSSTSNPSATGRTTQNAARRHGGDATLPPSHPPAHPPSPRAQASSPPSHHASPGGARAGKGTDALHVYPAHGSE